MNIRIVKEVCVTLSQSLLGVQLPGPMTTIVYHTGETIALLQEEEEAHHDSKKGITTMEDDDS
jgi:hypothetical protein